MRADDRPYSDYLRNHEIVIFDGHCNFCNGRVDFIIRRDKAVNFLLTASQAPAGQTILKGLGIDPKENSTVYLYSQDGLTSHSTAVLRICKKLGFPVNLLWVFLIVPKFLRDPIYRFIAARRYSWFGVRETCRIATSDEREHFLVD